jgi:hypothetical protein
MVTSVTQSGEGNRFLIKSHEIKLSIEDETLFFLVGIGAALS